MLGTLFSESTSDIIITTEDTASAARSGGINPLIFYGLCIGVFLLIIVIIILFIRQNTLQKKYDLFMKGKSGKTLEDALRKRVEELDTIKENNELLDLRLKNVERSMSRSYQKSGIVKYDAFKELGGKLSFAYALLDDENNGFIINSIHSREGSYNYVKEIIKGKSYISLSDEEKEALDAAIRSSMAEPKEPAKKSK
ncbi:MAG: DUF4446 family protein [Lachnospiraceae bacterium]|nr:DUF4446 family protein [Lachnospiraceae bacterium]